MNTPSKINKKINFNKISKVILDVAEITKASANNHGCGNYKEFVDMLREWNVKLEIRDATAGENFSADNNTIIITDKDVNNEQKNSNKEDHENINGCIIGYGSSYSGSAEHVIESLDGIDMQYLNMVHARYNNLPAFITETERLYIREMSISDLDEMYALYDTLSDNPFVEPLYEREEEEQFSRNYIDNMYGFFQYGLWLVFRKSDSQLIGRVGIENREIDGETRQELGYLIGSQYQRQGYGIEACKAVLEYGREYIGLQEIFLCTDHENKASRCMAESLGFKDYANVHEFDILRKALLD